MTQEPVTTLGSWATPRSSGTRTGRRALCPPAVDLQPVQDLQIAPVVPGLPTSRHGLVADERAPVKRRDRVLVVSGSVPPLLSGSAVIIANLAKQFSHEEMVVTGERPVGGRAITWRHEWPQLVYSISGWPPAWPCRGARWWRTLQLPVLFFRCVRLVRKHRCTAILVIFPEEEFLFAGYLAAAWTGAKLFAYFHDTYVENRTGLRLRFARWLQARVFTKASHVFVISEGMVDLYRERYPGLECSTLPHSFNGALPDFTPPPDPGSALRFAICGTISESCLEATVRVCEAIAQVKGASLTLLSGTSSSDLNRLGLLRDRVRHETVSPDQVVSRLRNADIVVLPLGFRGALSPEEYRTAFPTRTIEYLLCGRPILAHSPAEWYLTRFLKEHDCAMLVTEPSVSALLQAVEQLRVDQALRARLVRNALSAAEMFDARRVAALLRGHLGV